MSKSNKGDRSELIIQKKPREGWDKMFEAALSFADDDDALEQMEQRSWHSLCNQFDRDEWVWE